MGAWGPGLYSNDDAEDLKPLVRAVLRLPKSVDEIIELVHDAAEREASITTVDLVIADQLEKRGVFHPASFEQAIEILESASDIAELRELGMDERDLKIRMRQNEKLLQRLKNPRPEKPRKTLKSPQKSVVSVGDYVCYPTQFGCPRNPYFPEGKEDFNATGWGLSQVHDVGWSFGFLNWVKFLPLRWTKKHEPVFKKAIKARIKRELGYGTLSATHFKRMEMKIIGNERPRPDATEPHPDTVSADFVALNDIAISNALYFAGDK